jgi:hypothetical protein
MSSLMRQYSHRARVIGSEAFRYRMTGRSRLSDRVSAGSYALREKRLRASTEVTSSRHRVWTMRTAVGAWRRELHELRVERVAARGRRRRLIKRAVGWLLR